MNRDFCLKKASFRLLERPLTQPIHILGPTRR